MPPNNTSATNSSLLGDIANVLTDANNVLVTVSKDPSVDQLAACIGLTLALNKKDKHATAVFSGEVPSTIDFLEPDKTIEKNTDSLRDFIISLDKSKADKLRYKVEDSVVKIFITPYKTSISSDDLEFSQGDFNVDAVVAIGVRNRGELDAAIVAHGRILHDATITSLNNGSGSDLGSINWDEPHASSLSEMVSDLIKNIDETVFDAQISTALLTGIVAETDRFRNEKASPHTMTVSGLLMAAGANNQLVSTKLEEPKPEPVVEEEKTELKPDESEAEESKPEAEPQSDPEPVKVEEPKKPDDGTIQIEHEPNDIHIDDTGRLAKISEIIEEAREQADKIEAPAISPPETAAQPEELHLPEPSVEAPADTVEPVVTTGPSMIYEPPTFGGQLTANTQAVDQMYASAPDPLSSSAPSPGYTLNRGEASSSTVPTVEPIQDSPSDSPQTLTDLEKSVNSPHVMAYQETPMPTSEQPAVAPSDSPVPTPEPQYAREAVERAVQASADYRPEPIHALGAQPVGLDLGNSSQPAVPASLPGQPSAVSPAPSVPPPLPPMS